MAHAHADGVVDGVRNRWRHHRGCRLPDATRVMTRIYQLHVDRRHVRQPYRRVVVEVALLDAAVLQCQALGHHLACTPQRRALDLRGGITWIDHRARVHGDRETVDLVAAGTGIDRHLSNASDPGGALPFLSRGDGDAKPGVGRQRLSPTSFASCDPQAVGELERTADRGRS